jgi:hypothetical protein
MMCSSSHYWDPDPDSDSVSSIESSRCRERKHLEQQMSELRSVNASLRKEVQLLSGALQEKEEAILDMQEVHESKMLDLLKTKLSNTSASCECLDISSSASDQREEAKAGESKAGVLRCGRSVLSKIKTKASLRSIPKVVTICNSSQADNTSS